MALKVVYPTPPPTSNCLDPRQRAQLLRSSKKLAKLLGATPRFVDRDSDDSDSFFVDSPRGSDDSFDRPFTPSTQASSSTSISELFPRTSRHHARSHSEPSSPSTSAETPPVMRLALPHQHSSELDSDDAGFTLRPKSIHRLLPQAEPSFWITSRKSQRREKMDRLRRKFGDDIPAELVFPEDRPPVIISERGAKFVVVNRDKPLPVLPPLKSRRAPRDSLVLHRLRRESEESVGEGYRLSLILENSVEDLHCFLRSPTPTGSEFTDEGYSS